jgi:hypothetical protein
VLSAKCKVPSGKRRAGLTLTILLSFGTMILAVEQAPLDQTQLQKMSARFHPVDISADVSGLPANEQRALALMVKASHLMDALFLRQAWAATEPQLMKLLADSSPLGQAR